MCGCGTDHYGKGLFAEEVSRPFFAYVISTVVERSLDKLGMTKWALGMTLLGMTLLGMTLLRSG